MPQLGAEETRSRSASGPPSSWMASSAMAARTAFVVPAATLRSLDAGLLATSSKPLLVLMGRTALRNYNGR